MVGRRSNVEKAGKEIREEESTDVIDGGEESFSDDGRGGEKIRQKCMTETKTQNVLLLTKLRVKKTQVRKHG